MNSIYYLLAFISGTVLTMQVGINGKLMLSLGSPVFTSFISFMVGTIGLGGVYLVTVLSGIQAVPSLQSLSIISWWTWLGGLLGAFYIFSVIVVAPKIGFANMFSLVVAGQIILAILFDQFGVLGNQIHSLTLLKAVGVALLIAGVYLIQTN
jgi:transporter family-2 protein